VSCNKTQKTHDLAQQIEIRLKPNPLSVYKFACFTGASLKTGYLTPYLELMGPNFTNGANFAISGTSILPGLIPFSLKVQVLQFLRFRARSLELSSKGTFLGIKIDISP
jgi:hypothetical protein